MTPKFVTTVLTEQEQEGLEWATEQHNLANGTTLTSEEYWDMTAHNAFMSYLQRKKEQIAFIAAQGKVIPTDMAGNPIVEGEQA